MRTAQARNPQTTAAPRKTEALTPTSQNAEKPECARTPGIIETRYATTAQSTTARVTRTAAINPPSRATEGYIGENLTGLEHARSGAAP
jgi:hypothetical protein